MLTALYAAAFVPLMFAEDGGINPETWTAIVTYAPWVIVAVMGFMLFDRRRDKLRAEMQEISAVLTGIGFKDIPPVLNAIVRGDWEAAKTLWDTIKHKYGSKEGVIEATVNIIEESLESVIDKYPNQAQRIRPVIDRVAKKLGYTAPPAPPATT